MTAVLLNISIIVIYRDVQNILPNRIFVRIRGPDPNIRLGRMPGPEYLGYFFIENAGK